MVGTSDRDENSAADMGVRADRQAGQAHRVDASESDIAFEVLLASSSCPHSHVLVRPSWQQTRTKRLAAEKSRAGQGRAV